MFTPEFEYRFTDAAGNPTIRLQIASGKVILHTSDNMKPEQCAMAMNECRSLAGMLKIPYTEQPDG